MGWLPAGEAVWRDDSDEAPRLVRLWRRSPLSLLLCDAQGGDRGFVSQRVLPLTARRAVDRGVPAPAGAPSPRPAELVLRFDAARHADPAQALREAWWALWPASPVVAHANDAPPASLWKTASVLQAASGARVLLLLEGLADWLLPRNDAPHQRQRLLDDLAGLLSDRGIDAHALLVLDGWAQPLLASLWRRLPGLPRQLLLMDMTPGPADALPGWIGRDPAAPAVASELPRPGAFEATRMPPAPAAARSPVPAATRPQTDHATAPSRRQRRAFVVGAAITALGALLLIAWAAFDDEGRTAATATAVPSPHARGTVAAAAPAPAPADALAQVLSAAGLALASAVDDAATDAALARSAGGAFVLLRYDLLRAAAAPRGTALQVLAPLYPEALHFVVRADSPLQAVQQIASARAINVGPHGSARAVTAAAAWSALFGTRWREAQADHRPAPAALPALLAGEVEVALLVGDVLAREWRALPPRERAALRLLPTAPADPGTRRAQQRFLAAPQPADPLQPAGPALPGLAVMTFLTAAAETGPATVVRAAQALCAALPALRAAAPWDSVRPAQVLPVPGAVAAAATEVFERCDGAETAPARAASSPPTPTPDERKPS